ncbi:glycosyl-phosphatidylinositol-anchored molecule-like protein [Loxodonta africana]|uniref:glycosyl-phosphatidylinositol-anchored molecule-like protein n=1 Tax=Loxodonta africana TaxID=9785 RepID=UPI000C8139F9|nr:glycosyl-phosphatidylinositol-anchored molecule-like protein [Loxodonta africana]
MFRGAPGGGWWSGMCGVEVGDACWRRHTSALSFSGTYSLVCFDCAVVNSFTCSTIRTCIYDIRRCMTISIRLNSRELLVYKNCTFNCTFLYPVEVPPEAPRKITRYTNFYYVRCCSSMRCNDGGPTNIERDIFPFQTIEEELSRGTVYLGESTFFLSLASIISIIVGKTLT